jgi:uncharacterized membrane protein YfcA
MEYLVVCTVAVFVSGLTLFSGFGLGTVLMPAFALFFPVPVAIAATALVHLANNIFKVALVGRYADWAVIRRFAVPAACAALFGAALLQVFAQAAPLYEYRIGGQLHAVTAVKLVIGCIIVVFACLELAPATGALAFDRRYLVHGGLLSGFFGGLSGNQGALRSAFLIKAGLRKEAFVGTGTVSAVMVDIARLLVYGIALYRARITEVGDIWHLVAAATAAAFIGAYIGKRMIDKITMRGIQILVGGMLIVVGAGMAAGLL